MTCDEFLSFQGRGTDNVTRTEMLAIMAHLDVCGNCRRHAEERALILEADPEWARRSNEEMIRRAPQIADAAINDPESPFRFLIPKDKKPMENSTKCRSCNAPIIWAETKNGKAIPIDAEPTPDGNISLMTGKAIYYSGDELEARRQELAPLYKSHFATCPNAKQHRKK